VTEAEFNTCTDPEAMLAFLEGSGRAAERKLRLFAVACCRAAWRLFASKAVRAAVEASERYADGRETAAGLADARLAAQRQAERGFRKKVRAMPWALPVQGKFARQAAVHVAAADVGDALDVVGFGLVAAKTRAGYERARQRERAHRADLLRCLFGPLSFRAVRVSRAWRTPVVMALAKAVYDDRAWGEMPVLGDALAEAGCDDAEVLGHCRREVHARGCWVVDLLLNKG
jgi:hypothetical protein